MKVNVIDQDAQERRRVRELIESLSTDCDEFESAEEFIESARSSENECIISEIILPGMSGVELLSWLEENNLTNPMVCLMLRPNIHLAVQAMQHGAIDVVEKPWHADELWNAVRKGFKIGEIRQLTRSEVNEILTLLGTLTSDETQVLEMILEGKKNRMIASELKVSVRTVENRRRRLLEKTGCRSLVELARVIGRVEVATDEFRRIDQSEAHVERRIVRLLEERQHTT